MCLVGFLVREAGNQQGRRSGMWDGGRGPLRAQHNHLGSMHSVPRPPPMLWDQQRGPPCSYPPIPACCGLDAGTCTKEMIARPWHVSLESARHSVGVIMSTESCGQENRDRRAGRPVRTFRGGPRILTSSNYDGTQTEPGWTFSKLGTSSPCL